MKGLKANKKRHPIKQKTKQTKDVIIPKKKDLSLNMALWNGLWGEALRPNTREYCPDMVFILILEPRMQVILLVPGWGQQNVPNSHGCSATRFLRSQRNIFTDRMRSATSPKRILLYQPFGASLIYLAANSIIIINEKVIIRGSQCQCKDMHACTYHHYHQISLKAKHITFT